MKMFIIGIVIGLVWTIINVAIALTKNETLCYYRDRWKPVVELVEWIVLGIIFFFNWRIALGILTLVLTLAIIASVIVWTEKRKTAGY